MSLQSVQQECFDAANDEYLQEARDDLALFEVLLGNLRTGGSAAEEALPRMVGEVRKLLGLCTGMGLPLLDLLLRRLDNYLTDLDDPNPRQVDDLDVFVDIMRGLLENEVDDNVDEAEFVRSLPVRRRKAPSTPSSLPYAPARTSSCPLRCWTTSPASISQPPWRSCRRPRVFRSSWSPAMSRGIPRLPAFRSRRPSCARAVSSATTWPWRWSVSGLSECGYAARMGQVASLRRADDDLLCHRGSPASRRPSKRWSRSRVSR